MLSGYKTYIAAIVAIVGAVGAYLSGDADLQSTLQIVIPAVFAMTIRHGISTPAAPGQ